MLDIVVRFKTGCGLSLTLIAVDATPDHESNFGGEVAGGGRTDFLVTCDPAL